MMKGMGGVTSRLTVEREDETAADVSWLVAFLALIDLEEAYDRVAREGLLGIYGKWESIGLHKLFL